MDLQTATSWLFTDLNETVDDERRFRHSLGWRWPYIRDQHTVEDSVVPPTPFLPSFSLPFSLTNPHPHPFLPPLTSPSFAETCILFRKILFLAYTEMMHYKFWGHTALCIYVYTCIRGYHVEVRVCARLRVCVWVRVQKCIWMELFFVAFRSRKRNKMEIIFFLHLSSPHPPHPQTPTNGPNSSA